MRRTIPRTIGLALIISLLFAGGVVVARYAIKNGIDTVWTPKPKPAAEASVADQYGQRDVHVKIDDVTLDTTMTALDIALINVSCTWIKKQKEPDSPQRAKDLEELEEAMRLIQLAIHIVHDMSIGDNGGKK